MRFDALTLPFTSDELPFTVELLSELESVLSNPAAALTKFVSYSESFVVISAIITTSHQEEIPAHEATFFAHP